MFLLGSDDLLRGGFADRLGEALAREAVPGRQNSVIESLSSCSLHLWWGGRVRSCAGRYLKLVSRVLRLYLSGCMVWWCLCVVCHGTGSAGPDLAAAAAVTTPAQYSTRYSQHSTGTQHSPLVTTSTTLLSKKNLAIIFSLLQTHLLTGTAAHTTAHPQYSPPTTRTAAGYQYSEWPSAAAN